MKCGEQVESYPVGWKHVTLHISPKNEIHYDGDIAAGRDLVQQRDDYKNMYECAQYNLDAEMQQVAELTQERDEAIAQLDKATAYTDDELLPNLQGARVKIKGLEAKVAALQKELSMWKGSCKSQGDCDVLEDCFDCEHRDCHNRVIAKNIDAIIKERDEARAQVAVFGEALETIAQHDEGDHTVNVYTIAKCNGNRKAKAMKALSSTPSQAYERWKALEAVAYAAAVCLSADCMSEAKANLCDALAKLEDAKP